MLLSYIKITIFNDFICNSIYRISLESKNITFNYTVADLLFFLNKMIPVSINVKSGLRENYALQNP